MVRAVRPTKPEVWPDATPEEVARVEDAVHRLAGVREAAGYWTPIGKVVELLTYAVEPGLRERYIVAFVLGEPPESPE